MPVSRAASRTAARIDTSAAFPKVFRASESMTEASSCVAASTASQMHAVNCLRPAPVLESCLTVCARFAALPADGDVSVVAVGGHCFEDAFLRDPAARPCLPKSSWCAQMARTKTASSVWTEAKNWNAAWKSIVAFKEFTSERKEDGEW